MRRRAPAAYQYGLAVTSVRPDEQLEALTQWCRSTDAIAAATSLLRSRHLPTDTHHVDDVLAEVQFRIVRRIGRGGVLEDRPGVASPALAYARSIMGTVVDDMLRGRRHEVEYEEEDMETISEDFREVELASESVDEVRRQIHVAVRVPRAWTSAAALTVLTLTVDPDHPLRSTTPQPEGGSDDHRAKWTAIYYAGREDCFTDQDGTADAACRNRRLRAVQSVEAVLSDAYRAAIAAEVLG